MVAGQKWPDSVRLPALDMLKQAAHAGMTQKAACAAVATRMDPAPSVHTLQWWARAYGIFPDPPELRSIRCDSSADQVAEVADEDEDEDMTLVEADSYDRIRTEKMRRDLENLLAQHESVWRAEHERAAADWESERSELIEEVRQLREEKAALIEHLDFYLHPERGIPAR